MNKEQVYFWLGATVFSSGFVFAQMGLWFLSVGALLAGFVVAMLHEVIP